MKAFVIFAIIVWFICGFAGAWMLGKLDPNHWKEIALGPITLIEAFNDTPVTYPGP